MFLYAMRVTSYYRRNMLRAVRYTEAMRIRRRRWKRLRLPPTSLSIRWAFHIKLL